MTMQSETTTQSSAPAPSRSSAIAAFEKAVAEHQGASAEAPAAETPKTDAPEPSATPELEAKPDGEKPAQEAAAPEPPPSTATAERLKARDRIQKIRQDALRERQQAEAQRLALERQAQDYARQQQEFQQRQREIEELRALATQDPAKFIERTNLDMNALVRAKVEENKPESRISRLEKLLEMQVQQNQQTIRQQQEAAMAAQRQAAEREFTTIALSEYPALKALYEGREDALVREAYDIQKRFEAHFGKKPSLKELALNLDKQERNKYAKYERYQKSAVAGTAPQTTTGKSRTPTVSTKVASGPAPEKPLTDKEKRLRAIEAFQEAVKKPTK